MAQIVVRNLDDDVKARLKRRAQRHGQSMEAEVRDILEAAAMAEDAPIEGGLGSRLRARFAGIGVDLDPVIEELRKIPAVPARFDE